MNSIRYTILFNTNIVYQKSELIRRELPRHLRQLFKLCAERDYPVVIPETVLLEFKRNQEELLEKARSKLRDAYKTLDSHGIACTKVDPAEAVKLPDLPALIRQLGAVVEVESPAYEDLKMAHDRACLHAPPHPRNKESDEMRDLVIWMIALRLARTRKNVLLVSTEEIHCGPLGDDEAKANGLIRRRTVDAALEFLNVRTPAGELVLKMLTPIWDDLRTAQGMPRLLDSVQDSVTEIADPIFVQGKRWPAQATARMTIKTADDRKLTAQLDIVACEDVITAAQLTAMRLDDTPLPNTSIMPQKQLPSQPDEVQEEMQ